MKKLLLSLTTLICVQLGFAQGEASHWYFGNGAGLIFDVDNGTVTADGSAIGTINTNEGCSSISDPNGNLLFYTDGRTVWNRNYQIMPNANYGAGSGLLGDPSSTSSAVIVPRPGNADQYYVFTVDEPHHNNAWAYPDQGPADINGNPINVYQETFGDQAVSSAIDDGFNNGFNYSLVDLTLNGGLGDVVPTEKNIHLVTYDENDQSHVPLKCAEKITAVEHADGNSYWVITQFVDTFYAFRVDSDGVNTTPVTSQVNPFITTQGYRRNGIGYLKSSPDGSKLAICHAQNLNTPSSTTSSGNTGSLWLYDFDNATGTVSNPLNLQAATQTYGVDFSADSKKLYVPNGSIISQFDLEAADIPASQFIVYSQSGTFLAAVQLGPDGRIYVCNTSNNTTLDVINSPEELGAACDYQQDGIALAPGTFSNLGLPPFIQSFLIAKIEAEFFCFGDTTQFSIDSSETFLSILWDFGDTNTSTDSSPTHIYDEPGTYDVTATLTTEDEIKTFTKTITIFETPLANQPANIEVCDDDNDGFFSFDFSTSVDAEVLGTQDASIFRVKYFNSLDNAVNNSNELVLPYLTITNPQEIFVRIENVNSPDCFDTTSFMVDVFLTPIANSIGDIEVCDDASDGDDMNGQVTTDLSALTPLVLGVQDPALYSVSYHSDPDDANNGINALPLQYNNVVPLSEQIFVRIENNAKTDCYSTTSFNLIVNLIPEAYDSSLFQCDEDGIPEGFTLFNLTEANDDLTGGVPNRSTKFFTTLADAQSGDNEIDGNAFSNWENPQIIYVQVIDDLTGCFGIAELTLEVSATNANDAILEVCDDDGTEDGFHVFNLSDANATVLSGLPDEVTLNYYETYEDALLEQSALGNSFTNTVAYSQVIFVRVENDNACYGINEVQLTVFELPNIDVEEELLYCINFFPELITLSGGVIGDLPNNYLYNWSTGQTTTEIQVNQPGIYTVTVTNTDGCSKVRTITVLPSNIATIESIDVIDATSNNTITINVSGEGDYEYALDDINGPYQDSNFFENVEPGIHTVYVRDKNECGIVEQMVSVIGFPKFFTPNHDSYHDTWQVYGVNNDFQANSLIYIYDRFGKLLAKIDPRGPGWDGTFNGQLMPTNDYWFHVTLQDGRVFTSHFTLKR
ncbi:MAG: T9SS type B sorting domain-containing protein [Bacteroidia bacterium]|nr:T9SS type B sorting domain-containing protein [Bacteroidia bacterium]MBT8278345.1 T9SS type B sorting domain-containing protein [Bacteroidia bacterium]NND26535.1 T9SS type B sorting domain-containing protein [Flavobacteriaceae bacterium]NNK60092.1 T9SS type B sorting domain-containing protein [Flavobacteriaceae bacterium]